MSEASARLSTLFEGHRLTPTQRRIAQCVLRAGDEAPFLSSVELAERAGVSQPSVTRFAVALGFDGYPALRRRLRERLRNGKAAAVAEPAEPVNAHQRAVLAEIDHLRRLAAALAEPDLTDRIAEAGRLLARSRPLPVLGLRAAAAEAYGFAYFAAKVHPDVRLLDSGGSVLIDRIEAAAEAGADALLCFALPRHPREVGEALDAARGAGLRVVTVADSAVAPVAHPDDLLLSAPVSTALSFDTACGPLLLSRLVLEALCDALPDAQPRLDHFDVRATERGLFLD
ncbi:MurR/RpiR family transcriptional regulator [Streptomyces radicis]|uniref:MurR/RpiR family transcriptional regulator n=1 Tax=Streptomyces radicis TaxID=1750517 RepID=A0A3A9W677_9ACTN|nr:MurR/RpiR family transcriptional regulator [Streptomyces radicis]RKN08705.1 MurR/RpiR family transcriptional regulator [Streptomyces radicis]RKN21863.1 MurR/RpiR family transcriptional regulator [Streptomyces radicis]